MANLRGQLNSITTEQMADGYVTTTDVDWSLKHFFLFVILGAFSSALLSFIISRFNASPQFSEIGFALIASALLMVVVVFQTLLVKSKQLNAYLAIIEAVGLTSFLLPSLSSYLIAGAVCFAISVMIGHAHARNDLTNRLKVQFHRFTRLVTVSVVTGVAIFSSLLYAGMYRNANGVSFEAFQFLTAGSVPIVRGFIPSFLPEMSVDEFFLGLVQQQFAASPQLAPLSVSERTEVFRRLAIEFENRLAVSTKVAAEVRESVLSYFYRVTNAYLERFSGESIPYLPLFVIIVSVYWILKGVMFFVQWAVVGISLGVYQLLQSTGLVYVAFEPRKKEIIMLGSKKHLG